MSDRYQAIATTPVGSFLVKSLGLPDPRPLRRYAPGTAPLSGEFLVGGHGRLAGSAVACVEAAGGIVVSEITGNRCQGLVFDASGIEDLQGLVSLSTFFTPVLRTLQRCPHVVVLGTPPENTSSSAERVAQRSLEGFTRSLGKEIGRGGTAQLVYVDQHVDVRDATSTADAETDAVGGLESTLSFLLSPKSAYVSGQVVRVGAAVAAQPKPADPLRPLDGLVAIVTGASRGIGRAIARTLHRDGANIVGVDVAQAGNDLIGLMNELQGDSVVLDITTVDAPQRIARAVKDKHGGVDIVVHNAGITRDKRLANMTHDRWTTVIEVNVAAPQRITEELIDQSLIRPNGRVIGVSSIAGIAGNVGQTNYATSKAGVIGFVDAFAPIAVDHGVTVNAVAPGFIETQMTASVPWIIREAGRRMNSMSQGGLPIDVAETVAWYAHPGSAGVSGNVVRVCGQSLLGA